MRAAYEDTKRAEAEKRNAEKAEKEKQMEQNRLAMESLHN